MSPAWTVSTWMRGHFFLYAKELSACQVVCQHGRVCPERATFSNLHKTLELTVALCYTVLLSLGALTSAWHIVGAQQTCSVNTEGLTGTSSRAISSLQADLWGHGAALSHSYRNHSSGHFLMSLVSSWKGVERKITEKHLWFLHSLRGL